MAEQYFGLIEAAFVFALAIAFYIWQRRDLRRYEKQDRAEREARRANTAPSASPPSDPQG